MVETIHVLVAAEKNIRIVMEKKREENDIAAKIDHTLLKPETTSQQIIEAELIVGAVGDIAVVCLAAFRRMRWIIVYAV